MVRTAAAAGFWSLIRKSARSVRCCTERFQAKRIPVRDARAWLAAFLPRFGSASPSLCQTDPVKGEASLSATDGYARLLLTMADDIDVDVSTAGTILGFKFNHPVDGSVAHSGHP